MKFIFQDCLDDRRVFPADKQKRALESVILKGTLKGAFHIIVFKRLLSIGKLKTHHTQIKSLITKRAKMHQQR